MKIKRETYFEYQFVVISYSILAMSSGEVDLFFDDPPHEQLRSKDRQSESLHAVSPLLDLPRSVRDKVSKNPNQG